MVQKRNNYDKLNTVQLFTQSMQTGFTDNIVEQAACKKGRGDRYSLSPPALGE